MQLLIRDAFGSLGDALRCVGVFWLSLWGSNARFGVLALRLPEIHQCSPETTNGFPQATPEDHYQDYSY